jgi:beta-glucosidase
MQDPMLIARMGEAAVAGLAGPGGPGAASTYLPEPDVHIATEAKHYAAYGYGGRDGGMPAEISENTLYDVYLKPWYKYAQAGGRAIMASHNEVNGMPMHANKDLLTGALRQAFGFGDGLCASDAGDVSGVAGFRVAADQVHAGALAMNAGTDQDLEFPGAYAKAPDMLAAGLIDNVTLDRAVANVIRQKVAAGLFDNNATLLYVDATKQNATLNRPESRTLARQVAEEGITLLTNKDRRLPLAGLGSTVKKIAVIGPNADNPHSTLGLYGYEPGEPGTVTVLQAAAEAANASGNAFVVEYEHGSCLTGTPGCSCAQTGTKGGWSKNW